jgi:hypothetical protein
MRMVGVIVITLLVAQSCAKACNQKVYDLVYSKILDNTLDNKMSINEKNNTIEWLRKLCDGQKSRWELDSKGIHDEVICMKMSPRTEVISAK